MLMSASPRTTRVGVLLLDSIDARHRAIAGDYSSLFTALFKRDGVDLVFYDGRAVDLPDHGDCDGWVLPGSRESVYDDDLPWIAPLERWTAEALDKRAPLVGICFGHQLIGSVLGATVSPSPFGWNIGAINYEVQSQPSVLDDVPDHFRIIASHNDQLEHLPAGATLFASSERCPVAGFTVDDNVLCVQAHPEFVPELAESLYRSRVARIGETQVCHALETLGRPLDRHLVADWMLTTLSAASLVL